MRDFSVLLDEELSVVKGGINILPTIMIEVAGLTMLADTIGATVATIGVTIP